MVREANVKQAASEKQLKEARGKVSLGVPSPGSAAGCPVCLWLWGQMCLGGRAAVWDSSAAGGLGDTALLGHPHCSCPCKATPRPGSGPQPTAASPGPARLGTRGP